jgi:hypothetical protein
MSDDDRSHGREDERTLQGLATRSTISSLTPASVRLDSRSFAVTSERGYRPSTTMLGATDQDRDVKAGLRPTALPGS